MIAFDVKSPIDWLVLLILWPFLLMAWLEERLEDLLRSMWRK